MIRIEYVMLTIKIKDFKLRFNNKHFLAKKDAISVKPLTQKSKKSNFFNLFSFSSKIMII